MTTTDQKGYGAMEQGKKGGTFGEFFKVIIQAGLIALVVRTLLFQPFNIPSGSMIPTLLIGDFLFVSKYAYGYSNHSLPFSPPLFHGRGLLLAAEARRCRRLQAAARWTDRLHQARDRSSGRHDPDEGRPSYINDQEVPREAIDKVRSEDLFGHLRDVATYKETLPGGVSHTIIEIEGDTGFYDNTGVYKVPPDNYFMMGDNRDNSTDSRVPPDQGGVGYVPSEDLVGRAEMIFFSVRPDAPVWAVWEWPWTVRWTGCSNP